MLGAEKCAGQVGIERVTPSSQRHLGDRTHLTKRTGIVEGDAQPAEFPGRQRDQSFRAGFLLDLAGMCNGFAARGDDFGHQLIALFATPRGNNDLRALLAPSHAVARPMPEQRPRIHPNLAMPVVGREKGLTPLRTVLCLENANENITHLRHGNALLFRTNWRCCLGNLGCRSSNPITRKNRKT